MIRACASISAARDHASDRRAVDRGRAGADAARRRPGCAALGAGRDDRRRVRDKRWKAPRTSWGQPSLEGVVEHGRPARHSARRPEFRHARDADARKSSRSARSERREQRERRETSGLLRNEWHPKLRLHLARRRSAERQNAQAHAARRKRAPRRATRGTYGAGTVRQVEDFTLYDRCITRGVLGSLLPVIYGNGVAHQRRTELRRDQATRWSTTRA